MPPRCAFRVAAALLLLLSGTSQLAGAQETTGDSIVARVQRMASGGNAAGARVLADSVMQAATEGSRTYVDALFARASIPAAGDSARNDYLRIAVNYPASPRAEASLLRLAQMELAHGDRDAARQYLVRLGLEHPDGALRAQAAYTLGRVLMEQGAGAAACASLADAKAHAAPADVELSNQIAYYARPCEALARAADSARADSADRVAKAQADSVARADSLAKAKARRRSRTSSRAITRKPSTLERDGSKPSESKPATPEHEDSKPAAPKPAARTAERVAWSGQVAAYSTREGAELLSKRLIARGFDARVTDGAPFRVRIGRYARRADAVALVAKLKAANIAAIVVEAERP